MYTKEDINVLRAVSEMNHNMDALMGVVNDFNISAMKIVAEKEPEKVTPQMIIIMANHGVDVRELNDYFKDVVPECLEIRGKDTEKDPEIKKVNVVKKPVMRRSTDRKNIKTDKAVDDQVDETFKLGHEDVKPIPEMFSIKKGSVPPSGRKNTGNIVHDDLKKRGVIFVRCNKSPEIEERVVDELIQAADDRDIMIQEFIVNEKEGVNKLKAWMESGVIDYIIMNRLEEYNQFKIPQFFFLDEAHRRGIKVLLKENDFNPIFPY